MISGRYVRYRGLISVFLSDIFDSIRRTLRRKKEEKIVRVNDGYHRWANLEAGGGVNTGLPSIGAEKKEKEKEKEKQKDGEKDKKSP